MPIAWAEGYPELLQLIEAHGYDLQRKRNRLMAADAVAADWYDSVYVPGVTALRQEHVANAHSERTVADLVLWMHQQRRRLLDEDPSARYQQVARGSAGISLELASAARTAPTLPSTYLPDRVAYGRGVSEGSRPAFSVGVASKCRGTGAPGQASGSVASTPPKRWAPTAWLPGNFGTE